MNSMTDAWVAEYLARVRCGESAVTACQGANRLVGIRQVAAASSFANATDMAAARARWTRSVQGSDRSFRRWQRAAERAERGRAGLRLARAYGLLP